MNEVVELTKQLIKAELTTLGYLEENEKLPVLVGMMISYSQAFKELIKEERCKTCYWEKKSIVCDACDGNQYQDKPGAG